MSAATEDDKPQAELEQPMLEAQSSFSGADDMAAAFRTEPAAAAKPGTDDLMQGEEVKQEERDAFEVMFDC